ncbi:uncharacterized protein LOC123535406 [Mercenaria mercenaria]|uniref:uncharacterized protein LOC123535406 n=1 Tax=Mercenaria mercenaria TaxID=6596 RepID=UPI00234F25DB|nr:uncharacterized protein LOC123535406 [Mercenaria mercenaria]
MKPTLGMEEGKPVAVSIQGMVEQPEKPKRSRLIAGVAVGIVALVIIATVVGLSVYFGAKLTRDNFQEARQFYHTDDGKVVEEVSKVTEKEVTIKVPNVVESVYDYKNGLVVERFVNTETKEKSACYARYLNMTTAPTQDAKRYEDEEMALHKKTQEEQSPQKWKATTRQLSKHVVSENVAEMCRDTDIFWMEKVEDEGGIVKRETCYHIGYTYVCYPKSYACSYYCYLDYYCKTADGSIYLYKETDGWYCKEGCDPGTNNPVCP